MKDKSKKILHIAPHYAGGVGRVVFNYLKKTKSDTRYEHELIGLDKTRDKLVPLSEIDCRFRENMNSRRKEIMNAVADADIILIHWWNHPSLSDFLVREDLPASRVAIWSHGSCLHSPRSPYVFTDKIIGYPDLFIFNTPISLQAKEIKKLPAQLIKKFRIIWATGGVEHLKSLKPKSHRNFNVGYLGTVDYARINPDFFKISSEIKIPGVKFIVCGGPKDKEFKKEADARGLGEKFEFTGHTLKGKEYLQIFDVFGYPLNPEHYGTCDQSLQEAMAAGVVPIVLSNPMEKSMVKNNYTGIVARDARTYAKAIENLYKNPKLRKSLSRNAKGYAAKNFSLKKMVTEWDDIFKELLALPKTAKKWPLGKEKSLVAPVDVFLESLGETGRPFVLFRKAKNKSGKDKAIKEILKLNKSPSWQTDTRGTVHHYNSYFPGDKYLVYWSKLMKKII